MTYVIDKFSNSYRAWDQSRHVHHSPAMHGSCAAYGKTLTEAVSALEKLLAQSRPGMHCDRSCPEYEDDIY